jgi:hypothetical protein
MKREVLLAAFIGLVVASTSTATMLREKWNGTSAASLQGCWDVINSGRAPDEVSVLSTSAWLNIGTNYVARLSGWLTVPESGEYTFYYSSDDYGGLYLSRDEEMAKAVLIAQVPGWTGAAEWDKYPQQQKSAPMTLRKGQVMAIYAVMEQGTGGDNCAIGWTGPGINAITLITDHVTHIPFIPTLARDADPANGATDVPRDAVLGWTSGKYAATHDIYFGTVLEDVTNAGRAAPLGVLVSQGQTAATYDPVGLLSFGQTYFWRVDEFNAPPTDSASFKGKVWTFTAETFAVPVKPAKATASSSASSALGPERTIDGSGIDAQDEHSVVAEHMWLSRKGVSPIWIQYDFDGLYKFDQMWVWNSNQLVEQVVGFGARDVTVETSTDGIAWTALQGVPEFADAPGEPNYVHNTTVDFGGVLARHVKLTIHSNWADGTKQAGLSEVRFLCVPTKAYNPTPVSGAAGVAIDSVLNWRPGREAVRHEVYLAADPNAVTQAAAPVKTTGEHRLALGPLALEYGKSYFWRVNEVNDAAPMKSWEGEEWSFSTPDHGVVDDFESYDDECNRIFFAWVDGLGYSASPDCDRAASGGNGSGSTVGHTDAPFAERTIVHGGRQSMPLAYDNTAGKGTSEAVRMFDTAQDWTAGGAKTLVVCFRGATGNGAGQLYLTINGVKVIYSGSADVLTLAIWKQWNIDLGSVGTNLKAVKTLAVGVSGTGKGIVYIDDILLYRTAQAVVQPVDPGTRGLAAYYALNGDLKDGSGHGLNGTAVGGPAYVDGPAGYDKALQFEGVDDEVDLPVGSLISTLTSCTVTTWVNFSNTGGAWQRIFDFGTGPMAYMFLTPRQGTSGAMRFAITSSGANGESIVNGPATLPAGWHHVAVVIDGSAKTIQLCLDGDVVASGGTDTLPKDLGKTTQNWLGRSQYASDAFLTGVLDEFRIYSRPLAGGEVRYLAGDR